jgi:hypothetical protein
VLFRTCASRVSVHSQVAGFFRVSGSEDFHA